METPSTAYFGQQVVQEMGKHLLAPAWSVKQKLALTCQMLAAEGHESGLAGQISARAESPGSFWTLQFGLGFDEAEEGRIISAALGDKRAILLAHHGQLVASASVEEAAVLAVMIERVAKTQVLARSIGPIQPIKPELAQEAHDFLLKPSIVSTIFFYFARRVLRRVPGCIAR